MGAAIAPSWRSRPRKDLFALASAPDLRVSRIVDVREQWWDASGRRGGGRLALERGACRGGVAGQADTVSACALRRVHRSVCALEQRFQCVAGFGDRNTHGQRHLADGFVAIRAADATLRYGTSDLL